MIETVKRPVAGCLACVCGLIVLMLLAYRVGPFERLDTTLLNRLSAHKDAPLGAVATLVAHLADPLPQVATLVVVCLVALRLGRLEHAVAAVALVGGASLTTQVLKVVLAHQRYQPILISPLGTEAFPSGHATAAMAMAFACVLVALRAWRRAVILAGACAVSVVSCSIIVLHHHYPSDVLGGWLIAGGWCFAVVAGLRVAERLRCCRRARLVN